MKDRYEAVEIDGKWYIIDHKNPVSLDEQPNQREAEINARLWSILVRS